MTTNRCEPRAPNLGTRQERGVAEARLWATIEKMKAITILITLWLVLGSPNTQAVILDFQQISIDFTNAADAQAKATWSEPDKITLSSEGLGWDGEVAASRNGWIQTKPIAVGLSWRPAYAISVRGQVQPQAQEFTLSNGQKSTEDAGNMYVRYSPDLNHWSSWQALQRTEPESIDGRKTPGRSYSGTIRVADRERDEYTRLISEYSRLDVPWKSDEEAAVQWILMREPDFFAKHVPFIGYAEFLYEGDFHGSRRIQFLKVEISYGISGLHSTPRDEAVYKHRDIPWRYQDSRSPKTEQTILPDAPPSQR